MIIASPCNHSVNQEIYFVSGIENAILTVFTALLIPATIVANLSVVYSIIKTRQVNDGVNNMFICLSICICDCFVAAVSEVGMLILLTVFRSKRSCELELHIQYSSVFLCNFSGMLILSIAIDRFIKTRKTMKLKVDRNRRRQIYFMIMSLIFAFIAVGLDVFGTLMIKYAWINMSIQFGQLTAVVSICIVYIMTYYTFSKNQKKRAKFLNEMKGTSRQKQLTFERRMIATTTMILAATLFSYFPLLILGIHTVLKGAESSNSSIKRKFANYLSFMFGFSNSLFSAVIYLHRNRGCRNYILNRLHLTSRRAVSPSRSVLPTSIRVETIN